MREQDIYLIEGKDYARMAVRILEAADVAGDIGDRGKRIGIKPNILGSVKASSGAVTHPELVDGTISYLKKHGFGDIAVLEGSWVGDRTSRAVKVSGIYDVCQKHQVPFLDLQKDLARSVDAAGMTLSVCEEALRLDYLINIPVLKGHCQTRVTCALKNSKGLIPNSEKRRFHTLGLHRPIAHLNTVIHQNFILVDNICGDLDFEEGGNPVVMNRVLGFWDPVLCDSFAAECIGYGPRSIEYIRLAEELGIGSADVSKVNLIPLSGGTDGERAKKTNHRIEELADFAVPRDACSACYGALVYALACLQDEGELGTDLVEKIAIGQGYKGKPGEIGVGNCTGGFKKHIGGCPPKTDDILSFLRKEWV